jgi:peptide/nickel transport system ATP-binding protein
MGRLLEVRGLTVELPTPAGWIQPVNEVSVRIAAGEALGLVGESGSGKTMLSLALTGYDYTRELLSAVPELPST